MRLSTRGRYAVMAMVEMADRARGASCSPEPPVSLGEIAAAQNLSLAYLEQLFGRLRRAGLRMGIAHVVAMRGKDFGKNHVDRSRPPPRTVDAFAPQLLQLQLTVLWGEGGPRERLQLQSLRLVQPDMSGTVP